MEQQTSSVTRFSWGLTFTEEETYLLLLVCASGNRTIQDEMRKLGARYVATPERDFSSSSRRLTDEAYLELARQAGERKKQMAEKLIKLLPKLRTWVGSDRSETLRMWALHMESTVLDGSFPTRDLY
jgi:hypothetical protein